MLLVLALLLPGCRGFPAFGGAPPTPTVPRPSETELAWNEVEARLAPATALIRFELSQTGPFLATGIAYAPGLLLTIAPPLEGGAPQRVEVLLPGSSGPQPAELRGVSPCDGVAVVALQSTTALALAPLGSASETDIGVDVLVYGHSASDPDGSPV
ncbi:MAG: serine protease, partial [Thermomicrobium sp.]